MPRRQGRIVTIGSVAAFKGRTNGSIYAVAKAGMTARPIAAARTSPGR
jgi:3-oxoacyl-[acyl-carrier protein] reductase